MKSVVCILILSTYLCKAERPIVPVSSNKNINEQFLEFESNTNSRSQKTERIDSRKDGEPDFPTTRKTTFASNQNGHLIGNPTLSNNAVRQSSISAQSDHVNRQFLNLNKQNNFGSTIPLTTSNNGQANVKQLIQMYNNRDGETKRLELPNGNKNKPLSYSSVVAGAQQKGGHPSSQVWSSTPVVQSSVPVVPIVNSRSSSAQVTDNELKEFSETLLRKDSNNAAKLISINYQGHTSSSSNADQAPSPLLQIPQAVWNIPTIRAMQALLDNYEKDAATNEHATPMEKNEENAFIDAIMETTVMRYLMNILKEKGIVTPDPRQQKEYLKQIWFKMYSRGEGKLGSSGFEHIFLMEIRKNQILGLHNWLYFSLEEAANQANYLGYLKKVDLGDKGAILKFHFKYNNIDKPVDSMFIGTSPELEVALYTLCFALRANVDCPLSLNGKYLTIRAFTFRYNSKNMIGSAYPEI